jgi:hypothetical protein
VEVTLGENCDGSNETRSADEEDIDAEAERDVEEEPTRGVDG